MIASWRSRRWRERATGPHPFGGRVPQTPSFFARLLVGIRSANESRADAEWASEAQPSLHCVPGRGTSRREPGSLRSSCGCRFWPLTLTLSPKGRGAWVRLVPRTFFSLSPWGEGRGEGASSRGRFGRDARHNQPSDPGSPPVPSARASPGNASGEGGERRAARMRSGHPKRNPQSPRKNWWVREAVPPDGVRG